MTPPNQPPGSDPPPDEKPPETNPADSSPGDNKPGDVTPDDSKPDDSKPADGPGRRRGRSQQAPRTPPDAATPKPVAQAAPAAEEKDKTPPHPVSEETTSAPAPKPLIVAKAIAVSASAGSSSSKGATRMPQYLHPGVYVEEKPSDVKPITGVGTSTCGFVGIVPAQITILEPNPNFVPNGTELPFVTKLFPPPLTAAPGGTAALPAGSSAGASGGPEESSGGASSGPAAGASPAGGSGGGGGTATAVALSIPALKTALVTAKAEVIKRADTLKTALSKVKPDDRASLDTANEAKVAFRKAKDAAAAAHNALQQSQAEQEMRDAVPKPGVPILCTGFTDFKRYFGGFSIDLEEVNDRHPRNAMNDPERIAADRGPTHSDLAHGVYAFFNNGGTRCYVMGYRDLTGLQDPESLEPFEAVDEIALVAAPGIHDPVVQTNIVDHCTRMGDRFAILDSAPTVPGDILTKENIQPKELKNTDYGALYFPWIKVFDIASKLRDPDSDGEIYVGPSGHMAGLYAHVDTTRGVHKAPANEAIRGALDVRYPISNAIQDGLNPQGINCIRDLNGNIRPWGARTLGGDMNEDFKYINVRRLFLYLRKSIDRGTQWVVFEPNDRALWAKIVRNVGAFLTEVWRDGALFGSTPAEAFFVKCDDETNPPDLRELGRVTTEIGVAVTKPAEFVIFRIGQWAGPKGS